MFIGGNVLKKPNDLLVQRARRHHGATATPSHSSPLVSLLLTEAAGADICMDLADTVYLHTHTTRPHIAHAIYTHTLTPHITHTHTHIPHHTHTPTHTTHHTHT